MTATEFIAQWGPGGSSYDLNERQGAQPYFMQLCQLLGVPVPGSAGAGPGDYLFERDTLVLGAARGYADVFYRDHFAWENKAPGKNLDVALKQLLGYSLALASPPLLVVCDRLQIRIHTQFNGHPSEVHTVLLGELADPARRALLRRLWTDPESFRPQKTSRGITEAAAHSFATLAGLLRKRGHAPERVAHFLTQCLFCFFAEDVGLLPGRMFERMVASRQLTSERLTVGLQSLFAAMQGGGLFGADDIPWFNGGLFRTVDVPKLEILDITELRNAAALDWSAIDVSIFGTLFERGLDPAKRSQLGAHYTDPATIGRIVEPVVARPLLAEWAAAREAVARQLARSKKHGDRAHQAAHARFVQWLERLRAWRVLDPACGSGNFLFLALKALKDIEHLSHTEAAALGLDRETDLVTGPHNVLGIELNEYAAELARVTVWIGELQWRTAHGYAFKTDPVLEPLDHIECRDALVAPRAAPLEGQGTHEEAAWPAADAVIGNPPFLGDKWMRSELGDAYTDALRKVYAGRVPGGADLVTYWFDKAGRAIAEGRLGAAGLVATNSIRQRANRQVLEGVLRAAPIFEAWADLPWVNAGAAVRVSLVCFGASAQAPLLDGCAVQRIHADLKGQAAGGESFDLTTARPLAENAGASYFGLCLAGPFKVPAATAADWLRQPNPHGRPSSEVLRPIYNGSDVTGRWAGNWVVDFGARMEEGDAALYEQPFGHALRHVRPVRVGNARAARAKYWWRHGEARPGLRDKLAPLARYIATVETAKHRFFVWFPISVAPEHSLIVIPRADDVTFGVLSSRFHVAWALSRGGTLEDRPRYNSLAAFEPFPFPAGLTPTDTAHRRTETLDDGALIPAGLPASNRLQAQAGCGQPAIETIAIRAAAEAIARAAHRLDALRQTWLNPPEWTRRVPEVVPLGLERSPYPDRIEPKPNLSEADRKALQKRTLTNLYNARPAWLDAAHRALDAAVAAAYAATADDPGDADFWRGCTPETPDDAILARLLALNLARAAGEAVAVVASQAPASVRPRRASQEAHAN